MKKSKNNNTHAVLFYVSSVLCYLTAILNFVNGNNTDTGILWLGLGSTFLCVGSALTMKSQKDKDDKNQ